MEYATRNVYVTYIATTPEKLWHALTDSEMSRYYWGRWTVQYEPFVGGKFALSPADGTLGDSGVVLEWDPPRRLVVTWHVDWHEELRTLPPMRTTYEIDPAGEGVVRLRVTDEHGRPTPEQVGTDAKLAKARGIGWPMILSAVKSLMETGKTIEIVPPESPLD